MFFYFFDKTYQMKRKRRNLMKDYLQECVQKLSLSVIDETVDAELEREGDSGNHYKWAGAASVG